MNQVGPLSPKKTVLPQNREEIPKCTEFGPCVCACAHVHTQRDLCAPVLAFHVSNCSLPALQICHVRESP